MKRINFWIRNFFGFSAFETKGFIPLFLIIFCVLIFPLLFQSFYQAPNTINQINYASWDSMLISLDSKPLNTKKTTYALKANSYKPKTLHPINFNPNTVPLSTLIEIGFTQKTAQNLIKYRNKGGVFKQKADVKKIYGVSEEFYQKIKTYITLPDYYTQKPKGSEDISHKKKYFPKNDFNDKNQERLHFDINIVDAETLKKVRGIGDVLSQRIIKFRDQLGGFVKTEQVREVYGLKPEVANKLLSYCFLGESLVKQININQASLEDLKKHPYINYSIAKAIVNYREQHGNYSDFEELLQIKIINSEILNKIAPYLSI